MEMNPLVSIITPSYNQGKYIRETIESVLNQDYENIEYIVIDGKSTDETLDILSEYEGRITIVSENDKGQSDAINKGFKIAQGSIVGWLNSDDVYEPGCISRVVEYFNNNHRLSLLYGEGYIIDESSNKVKVFEPTQEFDYWKLVNFWDYIMQPATFFSMDSLRKVGFLDESLEYCMDWDLWIRLAAVGEVAFCKCMLACSREYSDTKTSMGGVARLQEIKSLLKKYSKAKHPLGIYSYSVSTAFMKYRNNSILRKWFSFEMGVVHSFLTKKMFVRCQDGWIGKRYNLIIPNYIDRVRLSLSTPYNKQNGQIVSILLNDRVLDNITIQVGVEKSVEITNEVKDYSELTIICCKGNKILKKDKRKLGVRVANIEFYESDEF